MYIDKGFYFTYYQWKIEIWSNVLWYRGPYSVDVTSQFIFVVCRNGSTQQRTVLFHAWFTVKGDFHYGPLVIKPVFTNCRTSETSCTSYKMSAVVACESDKSWRFIQLLVRSTSVSLLSVRCCIFPSYPSNIYGTNPHFLFRLRYGARTNQLFVGIVRTLSWICRITDTESKDVLEILPHYSLNSETEKLRYNCGETEIYNIARCFDARILRFYALIDLQLCMYEYTLTEIYMTMRFLLHCEAISPSDSVRECAIYVKDVDWNSKI